LFNLNKSANNILQDKTNSPIKEYNFKINAKNNALVENYPGYKVMKFYEKSTDEKVVLCELEYKFLVNDEIPDFRFISSFEQNIEPKNSNYIYLVIACPNYKTVGLKIPNLVISNKSPYSFSHWNTKRKTLLISIVLI